MGLSSRQASKYFVTAYSINFFCPLISLEASTRQPRSFEILMLVAATRGLIKSGFVICG
jgi:hypothetical protein